MLVGFAASVVIQFDLPPDRHGPVGQQGSVEAVQFGVVAAVDDVHGHFVFVAQAGDGVDGVPVDGVGGGGSGDGGQFFRGARDGKERADGLSGHFGETVPGIMILVRI